MLCILFGKKENAEGKTSVGKRAVRIRMNNAKRNGMWLSALVRSVRGSSTLDFGNMAPVRSFHCKHVYSPAEAGRECLYLCTYVQYVHLLLVLHSTFFQPILN